MIQPVIDGKIMVYDRAEREILNKETGQKEKYEARAIELFCTNPKGFIRVAIIGKDELPAAEGDSVRVNLSYFSAEKGASVARAFPSDVKKLSKAQS